MTQTTPYDRTQWNEFVASCPYGDVLQCWEWGELKARTGWEPLHFAVREQGRFLATALVLKRPIPRTGRSLFYCPRGPIVDPQTPRALGELVAAIRDGAAEHRAIALKIDPAITPDQTAMLEQLRASGFAPPTASSSGFGGVQPRAVMKVDISSDCDALLAGFHKKWRYNIRYAGRNGVTVRSDCTRGDIEPFYALLGVTATRDKFGVRSRSYYEDMWDLIIEPGLGKLFMTYADDKPIAGAIAFALGAQAWYVYGASSDEHRNLMPNHLMQWEMMQWAKEQGCTVYDMRGVSPEVDGEPVVEHLAGLNRFKKGFGAQYIEYVGDWDLVFSKVWHAVFQRLAPAVKRLIRPGHEDTEQ